MANCPAGIPSQSSAPCMTASAGSPLGSSLAMAIVWRIVSVCWSSWRRTISQIALSPTPRLASTDDVRSRTSSR
jgi:hypothetical protein